MDAGNRNKEARLRLLAARNGLQLYKSRARNPDAIDFGGYMLCNAEGNFVVAGGSPFDFSLSLDDVEAWLEQV